MRFTGERLPEGDPHFQADMARHLAAYLVARPYCAGRRVLDAGCGEGYGSALVATALPTRSRAPTRTMPGRGCASRAST